MCPFYRQMTVLMDRQPEVKQYTMSLSSLTFSHGDIKKHCINYTLFYMAQHDNRSRSISQIKQIIEYNLTINKTNKMNIYKHTYRYIYEVSTFN